MATATRTVAEECAAAKRASRELGRASRAQKNAALERAAALLVEREDEILEANAADLEDGRAQALTPR